MENYIIVQLELLTRLAVAGLCGCAVGFERKNRLKEAGIRTHMIVSIGAALIMIVSKYGFSDVLGLSGYVLDPSRIAAQIVSGIGFLGAGMIFVRKNSVNGLTTAAGIWTTAAVGMAIGASLYAVGIGTTVFVLLVQVILHNKNFIWPYLPISEQINMRLDESSHSISFIQEKLVASHIQLINLKIDRIDDRLLEVELYVKLPPHCRIEQLMNLFKDNPHIQYIEY